MEIKCQKQNIFWWFSYSTRYLVYMLNLLRSLILVSLLTYKSTPFSAQVYINKINDLSQLSNLHILKNEMNNKLFIYSLDGLNISNGINSKHYRSTTHNLVGNILQGPFVQDEQDRIWFTTYRALHCYNDSLDNFDVYRLKDENGKLIGHNYKIIDDINSDSILLKTNNNLAIFNIEQEKLAFTTNLDILNYDYFYAKFINKKLILLAGNNHEFAYHEIYVDSFHQSTHNIAGSAFLIDDNMLLVGTSTGDLLRYKLGTWNILDRKEYGIGLIQSISKNQNNYFLSGYNHSILLDENFDIIWTLDVNDFTQLGSESFQYSSIDWRDSLIWIGSEGSGVHAVNLKSPLIGSLSLSSLPKSKIRPTKILEYQDNRFLILSYDNPLYYINEDGTLINSWSNHGLSTHKVAGDIWNNTFVYANGGELCFLNPETDSITTISSPYERVTSIVNFRDTLILSLSQNFLAQLTNKNGQQLFDTLVPNSNCQELNYFFHGHDERLYISCNETEIIVYNKLQTTIEQRLPISGGILGYAFIDTTVLLTNYNGLYRISTNSLKYEQVIDKGKLLLSQIYGILIDEKGHWWLSGNNGILKYNPNTNKAHQFKMKDGLQGLEYNRMSYLKDSKGRFWFGGVNGINVFDPLKVKLSDKEAPIDFYNYKINDEDSREFGVANYVHQFDLYHYNNTITFEFVGIDYTGPEHVNLKYYMEGHDPDWVELDENNGVARYANLPYGEYTFHMLASNSDEVWSKTGKSVKVIVHPPFWATWWFRTIVGLGILAFGYYIVRSYYKRKLERRDLILRQQELKIEKQQAIEYERNRIASEMHDDLGSGLTTIKYLSEHAIKASKNEKENKNIKRIADHANKLVNNMSEIIWAMNSRYDTASDLTGYIRHYASEFLEEHDKTITFSSKGISHKIEISGEKRRNIFLVTKEILHNFIKYAQVDEMQINVKLEDNNLSIIFLEVGNHSFDKETAQEKGNGLFNMTKRMTDIGGAITQTTTTEGLRTTLHYNLKGRT